MPGHVHYRHPMKELDIPCMGDTLSSGKAQASGYLFAGITWCPRSSANLRDTAGSGIQGYGLQDPSPGARCRRIPGCSRETGERRRSPGSAGTSPEGYWETGYRTTQSGRGFL
ncbi:MAG: hypothetical protein AB1576_14365 [Bacillota bacterium]